MFNIYVKVLEGSRQEREEQDGEIGTMVGIAGDTLDTVMRHVRCTLPKGLHNIRRTRNVHA